MIIQRLVITLLIVVILVNSQEKQQGYIQTKLRNLYDTKYPSRKLSEFVPGYYPRSYSHTAITVGDLDKAIKFYQECFGLYKIDGPLDAESTGKSGPRLLDIFGPQFKKLRIAHLVTSNGIGIELFQFINPAPKRTKYKFDYFNPGVNHYTFIDPNIEELVSKIVANGGQQRTQIWKFREDKPYKLAFVEDPWGNAIEINTHGFETFFSN